MCDSHTTLSHLQSSVSIGRRSAQRSTCATVCSAHLSVVQQSSSTPVTSKMPIDISNGDMWNPPVYTSCALGDRMCQSPVFIHTPLCLCFSPQPKPNWKRWRNSLQTLRRRKPFSLLLLHLTDHVSRSPLVRQSRAGSTGRWYSTYLDAVKKSRCSVNV